VLHKGGCMARKPTNLWKRGNVYYLRIRVPVDLVKAFGREFVVQSLRTSDYREALERLRAVQGDVQHSFDALRREGSPTRVERLLGRGELGRLSSEEASRSCVNGSRSMRSGFARMALRA